MRGKERIRITEAKLRYLYEERLLNPYEIAEILGCSEATIRRRLNCCDIKRRSRSEAKTQYPKKDFSGDLLEKAYLIGFRHGDLTVRKVESSPESQTIEVLCSTSRTEQIELIQRLFAPYGHVQTSSQANGEINIQCYLNMTFAFLLPKQDNIDDWILQSNDYFIPFLTGYIDADGCIGVDSSNNAAYVRIAGYNVNILHQIYQKFQQLDILGPPPRVCNKKGTRVASGRYLLNQDYWYLAVNRKLSLHRLFTMIDPFLKHAKRRRDMRRAWANIKARGLS